MKAINRALNDMYDIPDVGQEWIGSGYEVWCRGFSKEGEGVHCPYTTVRIYELYYQLIRYKCTHCGTKSESNRVWFLKNYKRMR